MYHSIVIFMIFQNLVCGDLGINRKKLPIGYKMYKCVATHKAPRIHPVKIRKKKNNKM